MTSLILDGMASGGDFPRGYDVRVSDDGESWNEPVASGKGAGPVMSIGLLKGTASRYVRIIQTGSQKGKYWSIHELQVFGRKQTD
ncbi:MAG: discoidin domain-containing protein [Planctomycetota bacterium]|nr:discoidin domain-containing protein [Planctomycetota bacterium]MDA1163292.1 discoidin domain-containing protein [Planctomycetota bacterium]